MRFPFSVGLVVFGVVLGGLSTLVPPLASISQGKTGLFSSDIFFGILLPPLIYEAAIHVNYSLLRSRAWLILAFAFLGVIVSTVITGLLVSSFTGMPFVFALLVGAILSPTDPVAVLSLVRIVKLPAQLSTIIESESILNDAVGIVAFTSVVSIITQGNFNPLSSVGAFGYLVLGGLVVGLGFAALGYNIHKYIDDPQIETALSIVFAYGSYHVASAFGASGIISTAVTGIATGTWIVPRTMREPVRSTLFAFWSVIAYVVNSVIFLSMGLLVSLPDVAQNFLVIMGVMAFVTVARAAFIYAHYPLSRVSLRSRLPFAWYNTLVLAGVKGAVPMALALTLVEANLPISDSVRATIVSAAVGVALLSVTIQSLVAERYVKRHFEVPAES